VTLSTSPADEPTYVLVYRRDHSSVMAWPGTTHSAYAQHAMGTDDSAACDRRILLDTTTSWPSTAATMLCRRRGCLAAVRDGANSADSRTINPTRTVANTGVVVRAASEGACENEGASDMKRAPAGNRGPDQTSAREARLMPTILTYSKRPVRQAH
jgi:hypothetical protein